MASTDYISPNNQKLESAIILERTNRSELQAEGGRVDHLPETFPGILPGPSPIGSLHRVILHVSSKYLSSGDVVALALFQSEKEGGQDGSPESQPSLW